MIPRLDISFPLKRQWHFWFGKPYIPRENEYCFNHARSGIVVALRTVLPNGGNVGVIAYNCFTVANAIVSAGCTPVFIDVDDELKLDIFDLKKKANAVDALIVTNLLGIHNDISKIRAICPNATIIIDNAHGYGLPEDGDFVVYSINQGKYPALGPGGILVDLRDDSDRKIDEQYHLPFSTSLKEQIHTYIVMLCKSILYLPIIYGLFTYKYKQKRKSQAVHSVVNIKPMCIAVARMYNEWLKIHKGKQIAKPFMDFVHTKDIAALKGEYAKKGIEVETHFKNAIIWAKEFGYKDGDCPNAERLVNELVMIPNYYKWK